MIPAGGGGTSLQASSSAAASASSRSGDASQSFQSGDFIVGGDKNMIWLFVIAGVVAVAFFYFKGRK